MNEFVLNGLVYRAVKTTRAPKRPKPTPKSRLRFRIISPSPSARGLSCNDACFGTARPSSWRAAQALRPLLISGFAGFFDILAHQTGLEWDHDRLIVIEIDPTVAV